MAIVRVENVGQYGIIEDAIAHDLPLNAWSSGENVRFRDGMVEKIRGHVAIYDPPSVVPYHLLPLSTGTTRYWLYAGLTKIYVVTGTTHTNLTRQSAGVDVNYTATADNVWTSSVMGGIAVLNNGTDAPQFWGGNPATRAAALTNWPASTTCKAMRAFKNYLVAMDVTKATGTRYPHMVKWSHPADAGSVPSSWDETDPTKDAGEYDLADDQSRVIDGMALGEQFIIYKEGAYYGMQPIGRPAIFRFTKLSGAAGALTRNCIAEYPGGHLVLTQGDVIVHQGGSPQSILTRRMKRWLQNNVDADNYARSFCFSNPLQNEIWICLVEPEATSATLALIWNHSKNTFTTRELPNAAHAMSGVIDATAFTTWASDAEPWDADDSPWNVSAFAQNSTLSLLASVSTKLHVLDITEQFNATDMTAYVQREGLSFGSPQEIKTVLGIRPRVDSNSGTVNVYVAGTMDLMETPTYSLAGAYDPNGTSPQVDCFVTGRYIHVKFESTSYKAWRMYGYDVDVISEGQY